MNKSLLTILAIAAVFIVTKPVAAQDAPPLQDMLARFVKIEKIVAGPRTVIVLTMTPAAGGSPIPFIVPNQNAEGKTVELNDAMKEFFSKMKPGELYELKYNIQGAAKTHVLQGIEPFTPRDGENEPNVYAFVRSGFIMAGSTSVPTVEATKIKKPITFLVPLVKVKGKSIPDEKIMAVISKLKPDDLVEVQLAGSAAKPILKSIRLFEPPVQADVGEISKKDGYNAVEVSRGSDSKTLLIPRNNLSLLGKLRQVKQGTSILYKANADDKGVLWLIDFKVTPKDYMPPQVAVSSADANAGTEKPGIVVGTGRGKLPQSGQDVDYVEIKEETPEGTTSIKFLISQKDAITLMPKVKTMPPGTAVMFKSMNDLVGMWLLDIRVKEATPTSKPAEAEAPKGEAPAKPEGEQKQK